MKKLEKKYKLSLDKFIDLSLYDKKLGYYMNKNPFGKKGDYITAPHISRLFSEMIAIWTISFWQSLGCPKKINLIELGAGNGEMMKILIESSKNFPIFFESCQFMIHEKSPRLIKEQKKKLKNFNIVWLNELKKINSEPSIFIANEFFDAHAIKQFIKKNELWYEKFVNFKDKNNAYFFEKKIDMKKFEKKINYRISENEKFIEYSEIGIKYLKNIAKIIKKNSGGLLLIDYGYFKKKMKNSLQAVSNHRYSNLLKNFGKNDITHHINFSLFGKIISDLGKLSYNYTTQKEFLIKMGIKQRAELISKNLPFLKKTDIYYRVNRLIDDRQMGKLFKVMLIKNKDNKFKLGF